MGNVDYTAPSSQPLKRASQTNQPCNWHSCFFLRIKFAPNHYANQKPAQHRKNRPEITGLIAELWNAKNIKERIARWCNTDITKIITDQKDWDYAQKQKLVAALLKEIGIAQLADCIARENPEPNEACWVSCPH